MRRGAVLIALALAGYTVGPDFTPPSAPDIASWKDPSAHWTHAPVSQQSNPDPNWWTGFKDPVLTALIRKPIGGNLDLQQAVLRVMESRQGEMSARAAGLPTVGGSGSYMCEQLGLRGLLLSRGAYDQAKALGAPGSPLNTFSPGLGTRAASAVISALNQFSQPVDLFQYGLNSS